MDLVPTVGFGHIVGAARVGWRLFSWLRWVTVAFPVAVAVACLLGYVTLQGGFVTDVLFPAPSPQPKTVGYQCDQSGGLAKPCFPTSDGTNAFMVVQPSTAGADKPRRTAGILSGWLMAGAICASLTAVTMWLLTALAGGVLERSQRRSSVVVGAVKGTYDGIQSDLRKGKADAKRAAEAGEKAKGLWAKARGRGEAGEPVDLEKKPRSTREGRREAKAEIARSKLEAVEPEEAPPGFGGYASDAELVDAGALIPEAAIERAAVTGDPYASPAEKREVMS